MISYLTKNRIVQFQEDKRVITYYPETIEGLDFNITCQNTESLSLRKCSFRI